MSKLRIGLLYGGRSVEHEVSITSATSILEALDSKRYDITLIGVDQEGRWHSGPGDRDPGRLLEGAAATAITERAGEDSSTEVLLPAAPVGDTLVPADSSAALSAAELDVIFPIIHGRGGEDGALQGLLELAGVAYVGSGVLSSAMQMDKDVAKRLLAAAGLPVVPWLTFKGHDLLPERIPDTAARGIAELGAPLYVKPANSGSSVGIHRVENRDDLVEAIRDSSRYDSKVLLEQSVDAREIEVAVLGNDSPQASLPGEIRPRSAFYDYEAKYQDDATELIVPAEISQEQSDQVRELAVRAFRTLDGAGLARVDFLLARDGGALYINELNSLPGFTSVSMYPRLWEATGLPYSELLDRLIELALERHEQREALVTKYEGSGGSEG
ncbi:MAG: D-alanine--D-alanine ligase family protein [Myxococcota bacterium]|jgi:D-alanine-D-alanine ligase|nr:D-alanine--D-alanine ligase family protein [Myxococcota bacterium]